MFLRERLLVKSHNLRCFRSPIYFGNFEILDPARLRISSFSSARIIDMSKSLKEHYNFLLTKLEGSSEIGLMMV